VPEAKGFFGDNAKTSFAGIGSLLQARAFAYDLLKSVFLQEPSRELVALLIEGDMVEGFPFADANAYLAEVIDRVAQYLNDPGVLSERSCEMRRWDYTRMFVGPGKVPASPFESIYRDAEQLYFSQETLQVREAYRKYNLLPRHVGREPDDHVGLELEFMHRLCAMAGEKAKAADQAALLEILNDQVAFLDEHLMKWVPHWTSDVVKSAHTEFYRGMAELLDAFLKLDREMAEELIGAFS
jgi:TorA maturation chaperone TorD